MSSYQIPTINYNEITLYLCPLQKVLPCHSLLVNSSFLWCNLVDELSVDLTVLDVIMEVANSSVRPSL